MLKRTGMLAFVIFCVVFPAIGDSSEAIPAERVPTVATRSPELFRKAVAQLAELSQQDKASVEALSSKRTEVDRLGAARYSHISGLYWYTNFDRAQREARRTKKPILSLRLMGDLRNEYSCANSRYFRTILYSDPAIAEMLRENFVVYWQSVRDVPKITIEFGDGRKLCGTITGNSIHYVLSSDGSILDAFPGLYEPQIFLEHLKRCADRDKSYLQVPAESRRVWLTRNYRQRLTELTTVWGKHLATVTAHRAEAQGDDPQEAVARVVATASRASRLSVTKRVLTEEFVMASLVQTVEALEQLTDDLALRRMADAMTCRVSDMTRKIVANESYGNQVEARIAKLESALAADTVLNEFRLRPELLRWLIEAKQVVAVDDLNRRVYADLFLTPGSDPWFGLLPEDRYTALVNDGVRE
ncbi:MAG: hypothetical protein VB878_13775 [Pirellulaceae bacterium]